MDNAWESDDFIIEAKMEDNKDGSKHPNYDEVTDTWMPNTTEGPFGKSGGQMEKKTDKGLDNWNKF